MSATDVKDSVAPGEPELSSSFAERFPELGAESKAIDAPAPEPVIVNDALAEFLGIDVDWLNSDDGTAFLAGIKLPAGSAPIAMAYAGHQFGGYSPVLGDGRAILIGEVADADGELEDIHLKGSGRTPFSRGGDGLATLPAMLREYLMAEAMHALAVPTSRGLGVVTTGLGVRREKIEAGAVLARVARSHIRVGTFEFTARRDPELVRELVDYSLERHYPELADAEVPALALLEAVANAQAKLIAKWMLLGFVHGVMNTDNVLISGETIDYGPCAFLETHDPATVFSSIDRHGRYAFGNQPVIGQWNLARLAETLLPLIDDDGDEAVAKATIVLESFPGLLKEHWLEGMASKIGLVGQHDQALGALASELVEMMTRSEADHTLTFRALAKVLRGETPSDFALASDSAWENWSQRWQDALGDADKTEVAAAMDAVNPVYIPRNHLVEEALSAAGEGNLEPFQQLLDVTTSPYVERDGLERYGEPAPTGFTESYQTFCGT